jgi:MFS family permease
MVLIYTHLGVTPIALVIASSVVLFVGISARMISSQALISTIPAPHSRGAFMAIGSSIQQFSGGVAASLAGWMIVAPETGPLQHFERIGFVIVGAVVITFVLMNALAKNTSPQPEPVNVPSA